jgi:dTDP-4-amino-4,6-dideoxygalactose transaminase
MNKNNIYVTQPILPEREKLNSLIDSIYESKVLTNMGQIHCNLKEKLKKYLGINNLSLFSNGTIALMVGLKALDLPFGSEVITTPFTFAATAHAISWCGLKPVFCDINEQTMTIDPKSIISHINDNTVAILGVHVYGFPCDVDEIKVIADKYKLKVIYDAAHAFTTKLNNQSICNYGDITMLSFHATKLFNTIEGGALVFNSEDIARKATVLKNFGIINEDTVSHIGINGKMNELQAAFGILNLQNVEKEKNKRKQIAEIYTSQLQYVPGIKITFNEMASNCSRSYQYFPIRIDQQKYGISRDELYLVLRKESIFARKYFYPLCSQFTHYQDEPSSCESNLPVANMISDEILCLPFYGKLANQDIMRICKAIKLSQENKR